MDLWAGRAFGAGRLDARGDLEAAVDAMYRAGERLSVWARLRLARLLHRLPNEATPQLREAHLHGRVHSRTRDRAAIGFHYDLPVEFYRTFLDRELVYSSAYYTNGAQTLDDAQLAKLDLVLERVQLRPGERLLDIGCGWGAMVIRAAQRFGAQALGITLSRRQYEEASRRIAALGLSDRAAVQVRDYRDLRGERFDKIVSIGMVEHVGRRLLPRYFRGAYGALRPGGLFLNSGIAEQSEGHDGRTAGFIGNFIFPDGELVTIADALQIAERAGFEVRGVENLREHYGRTVRAWLENLDSNHDAAIAAGGEETYRVWRLYLAGSAQGFHTGRIGVYQSLLARPTAEGEVPSKAECNTTARA